MPAWSGPTGHETLVQAVRVVHDHTNHVLPVRHIHAASELIYIVDGTYQGFAGDEPVTLGPGQGLVVPLGLRHGCTVERVGSLVLLVMQWTKGSQPDQVLVFTDRYGHVGHPLHRLVDLAETRTQAGRRHCQTLVQVVVQEVAWLLDAEAAPPATTDRIAQVRQHLERHHDAGLDLAHLCHLAGTSPATLNRQFRQRYGQSPMRLLQDLRLQQACRLLATTNHPLTEIARTTGIGSATHLGRLLKKRTGQGVRAWRRRKG